MVVHLSGGVNLQHQGREKVATREKCKIDQNRAIPIAQYRSAIGHETMTDFGKCSLKKFKFKCVKQRHPLSSVFGVLSQPAFAPLPA